MCEISCDITNSHYSSCYGDMLQYAYISDCTVFFKCMVSSKGVKISKISKSNKAPRWTLSFHLIEFYVCLQRPET